MADDLDFLGLGGGQRGVIDAKWNIFRYQDHLNNLFEMLIACRMRKHYPAWVSLLSGVLCRSRPFFNKDEKETIDKAYIELKLNKDKEEVIHKFELLLFDYMQNHNLLMQMVRKTGEGAGGA
jgi:hypothetical protein